MSKKKQRIMITHTVTMLIEPDTHTSIQEQMEELKTNCEAVADYAFGEGSYTQDTEATIVMIGESISAVIVQE